LQDRKDEDLVYMFAYVNGFLEDATVDNAVIDVNGFGINVRISADTGCRESEKKFGFTLIPM